MYRVEVKAGEGSSFKVSSKDYEFIIDTRGKGITPPDTLLASLGSCIGVYLRKYLEGAKIAPADFNITVEADFSGQAPACFRQIKVGIDLKGMQLDERRKRSLLEFIKNCPVHNTLKNDPLIEVTLKQ